MISFKNWDKSKKLKLELEVVDSSELEKIFNLLYGDDLILGCKLTKISWDNKEEIYKKHIFNLINELNSVGEQW